MTSQEQLSRLMVLIPWLREHPGAQISEVRKLFSLSRAQIVNDLQVAVMCGLPGGLPDDLIDVDMDLVRGEGVITLANADFLARPMRFTADEARSLVVALQAIAETATGSLASDAANAAAKITTMVPTGEEIEEIWVELANGDPAIRAIVAEAINAKARLKLEYGGESRAETSYPVVDPVRLVMRDSVLYLQAWSLEPAAWRTYRVERIEKVSQAGLASDHGLPPDLDQEWASGHGLDMIIEVDPSASWITEYYPVSECDTISDGWLRLRLGVWDESWAIRLLLRLGEHARLIEPASLSEQLRHARDAALAAYQHLG